MAYFEVLLTGGTVLDGTGRPAFAADIGVSAGRIAAVGDLSGAVASTVLDVATKTVTPGLIDTHSHADVAVFAPEQQPFTPAVAPLLQGVTTEVCGNCGFSVFPVPTAARTVVEPVVSAVIGSFAPTYESLDDYRTGMSQHRLPTNLAPLVGHGTLRCATVGLEDRPATDHEQIQMERLLEEGLEQGAFGLSSGLIYPPGLYADTAELRRLAAVCGRFERPYATHMRSETDAVLDGMLEALEITGGRTSLHISHHKVAGRRNFGRSHETLALVDRQWERGIDISLDAYPYTAGSTTMLALLPPWANIGPVDARLDRLGETTARDRIRSAVGTGIPGWENLVAAAGWDGIVVAAAPLHPEMEGLSIAELADERDPVDMMCDILRLEHGAASVVVHMMDQRDVDAIITSPHAMIGSDGVPLPGRPHPRLTGTFARVLGRVSRDRQLLDSADAVRKMTSVPAQRFGLTGRGVIKEGAIADIAVFAMDEVIDTSTYENPWQAPRGVSHVLVGGVVCVAAGFDTGRRNGLVLEAS